jgi:hypothetical protein
MKNIANTMSSGSSGPVDQSLSRHTLDSQRLEELESDEELEKETLEPIDEEGFTALSRPGQAFVPPISVTFGW